MLVCDRVEDRLHNGEAHRKRGPTGSRTPDSALGAAAEPAAREEAQCPTGVVQGRRQTPGAPSPLLPPSHNPRPAAHMRHHPHTHLTNSCGNIRDQACNHHTAWLYLVCRLWPLVTLASGEEGSSSGQGPAAIARSKTLTDFATNCNGRADETYVLACLRPLPGASPPCRRHHGPRWRRASRRQRPEHAPRRPRMGCGRAACTADAVLRLPAQQGLGGAGAEPGGLPVRQVQGHALPRRAAQAARSDYGPWPRLSRPRQAVCPAGRGAGPDRAAAREPRDADARGVPAEEEQGHQAQRAAAGAPRPDRGAPPAGRPLCMEQQPAPAPPAHAPRPVCPGQVGHVYGREYAHFMAFVPPQRSLEVVVRNAEGAGAPDVFVCTSNQHPTSSDHTWRELGGGGAEVRAPQLRARFACTPGPVLPAVLPARVSCPCWILGSM